MSTRPLIATVLLTLAVNVSIAQVQPAMPAACNEEFARFLVDQQVAESRNLAETDKRIRILIRSAEFLWTSEEPLAREYFGEAFKVANDRYREKGLEKSENKGLLVTRPDYRFEVIRAIAGKDPSWSKKLVEQVLKEYEKEADGRDPIDKSREIHEVIRVAQESVKINPELSRFLFRRVMQRPLDYHWFWVLFSVADLDVNFADQLYSELLENYASATPRRFLFLSAYPFASQRMFGPDKYGFGATVPAKLSPNPNLQRKFIGAFLRRAISYAGDPENLNLPSDENRHAEPVYLVMALSEIEPTVIQRFPLFIQQLSEAKALAAGMLTEQMRKDMSDQEKRIESLGQSFEERLKKMEVAEANGKLTDEMIVSLLTWGDTSKTDEQFKKIEPWLSKIQDESARYETINFFWFLRAQLAVKENRLAEAEVFAKKVPEIEHRAIVFFEIAEAQLKNINDAATVHQTLRDVGRLAEQSDTSVEKARVLIALANQYIKVNRVFAMQELSDAIKVINRLESGDVMSTYTGRQIRTKNSSYFASFPLPGQNLEGTFKEISKNNFEMSLSNAKSLEDKYLQTLAVLAVAQNCVVPVKKKPVKTKPATKPAN